jgi:hypothetical protein
MVGAGNLLHQNYFKFTPPHDAIFFIFNSSILGSSFRHGHTHYNTHTTLRIPLAKEFELDTINDFPATGRAVFSCTTAQSIPDPCTQQNLLWRIRVSGARRQLIKPFFCFAQLRRLQLSTGSHAKLAAHGMSAISGLV